MESKLCLVCEAPIAEFSSRLGIEACRSCASFFKRAKVSGKCFTCRQGGDNCIIIHGDQFTCRKCRFEKCIKFGMELQPRNRKPKQAVVVDLELPSTSTSPVVCDESSIVDPMDTEINIPCRSKSTVILDSIRTSYRSMCEIRLISELLARPEPPHPVLMNEEDFPLAQASLSTMLKASPIFLSAILSFGKSAFPEFSGLSKKDQWALAVNFSYRFRPFESSHRADKQFPEDPERLFAGYTSWYTHNYDDQFFKGCNPTDIEHVKSSMHNFCKHRHMKMRAVMSRLRLAEPEFLYMAALMFWTTEGAELPECVHSMADKKRTAIMQELHVYFREEKLMDNYAARLGELLSACQLFDMSDAMKANYEFLRLLNVFSDETFLYCLHRE